MNFLAVFVFFQEVGNLVLVAVVVEEVSGRKTVSVSDLLQTSHDYLKQALIFSILFVELFVEDFFTFGWRVSNKDNDGDCIEL